MPQFSASLKISPRCSRIPLDRNQKPFNFLLDIGVIILFPLQPFHCLHRFPKLLLNIFDNIFLPRRRIIDIIFELGRRFAELSLITSMRAASTLRTFPPCCWIICSPFTIPNILMQSFWNHYPRNPIC